MGASYTFRGHLARCGTVGEDLSVTLGDWLMGFYQKFLWWYLGWNEEPTQNFSPIGGRLAGEPAFRKNCKKVWRLPAEFHIGMALMWCSDWAEILCGNISWLEEHPLKISGDLRTQFGRCFITAGASWARCARFVGIWRAVALSETTSLRH